MGFLRSTNNWVMYFLKTRTLCSSPNKMCLEMKVLFVSDNFLTLCWDWLYNFDKFWYILVRVRTKRTIHPSAWSEDEVPTRNHLFQEPSAYFCQLPSLLNLQSFWLLKFAMLSSYLGQDSIVQPIVFWGLSGVEVASLMPLVGLAHSDRPGYKPCTGSF